MQDDIILNKIETIKRCIKRIQEEYQGYEQEFHSNYTKQDSIILNLERLSQASIDIATHIVRVKKLGVPQTSRDVFILLEKENLISEELSHQMQSMVGFRNIAVHTYRELDLEIVIQIIKSNLEDFYEFIDSVLSF
jgi:uncharacterized protein YutE (UPF0331/DUF86 family)